MAIDRRSMSDSRCPLCGAYRVLGRRFGRQFDQQRKRSTLHAVARAAGELAVRRESVCEGCIEQHLPYRSRMEFGQQELDGVVMGVEQQEKVGVAQRMAATIGFIE